jgi:hypothetical protein
VVFLDEYVHELDPLDVREITMGVLVGAVAGYYATA